MKKISNNIRIINAATTATTIAVIDVLGDVGKDWWTDGGYTKEAVLNDFRRRKIGEVHFNISSLGGDYAEALAIKNMAIQSGAEIKVHYFGMVASAATEIGNAAARKNTTASSDFFMLIHNTSTWAGGNKESILRTYDSLAKFDSGLAKNYAAKSGKRTAKQFEAKMTEDVWMNADEALEWGLIGSKTEAQPISAHALQEIRASMSKLKIGGKHAGDIDFFNSKTNDVTEKAATKMFNKFIGLFQNAGLRITSADKKLKVDDLAKDITAKFKIAASRIMAEEEAEEEFENSDYSAVITDNVESIELTDGSILELGNFPYEISAAGAEALQSDLEAMLTADSVSVVYNDIELSVTIDIVGCVEQLATINGAVEFTQSSARESDLTEVEQLETQIRAAGKKLASINRADTSKKVAALKTELAKINNRINSIAAGKSGRKAAGGKPAAAGLDNAPDEENGAGFLSGVIRNYHTNNQ